MSAPPEAPRNRVRRQARATGVGKLGRVIIGEMSVAGRSSSAVPVANLLRLREIETVIRARHGAYVPDGRGTEDLDACIAYLRAAAGAGVGNVRGWARRWAPWLSDDSILADLEATEAKLARSKRGRFTMLPADAVAALLSITLAERSALNLRTIGACDLTTAERKRLARERKRQRDRDRQAVKRQAAKRVPRDVWLSQSQEASRPWEAAGMSRRTWYRKRGTGLLANNGDIIASDTPVPNGAQASIDPPPSCDVTALEVSSSGIQMHCRLSPKGEWPGSGDKSPAEFEAEPHGAFECHQRRSA